VSDVTDITWIVLLVLCPSAGGRCVPAPEPPPVMHYFAQVRCEQEKNAIHYEHPIPAGLRLERLCIRVQWP
jgi:hypothetical protein